jgi:hypothetical protein
MISILQTFLDKIQFLSWGHRRKNNLIEKSEEEK